MLNLQNKYIKVGFFQKSQVQKSNKTQDLYAKKKKIFKIMLMKEIRDLNKIYFLGDWKTELFVDVQQNVLSISHVKGQRNQKYSNFGFKIMRRLIARVQQSKLWF